MKDHVDTCKIEKWRRWIKKDIWPEVMFLLTTKIVYEKMENVVRTKKDLPDHSSFYWWIRCMYTSAVSSAIRRQTDLDTQCISMARLLSEIRKAPQLIRRIDYVQCEKPRNETDQRILKKERERLDEEFTRLAGAGEYLDPAVISGDFNSLSKLSNEKAKKLIEFTDWYIAHHDKRLRKKGDRLPTYIDLNSLIDVLVNLFVKYSRLVTGGGVSLVDDIQKRNLEREIELIFDP